MNSNSEANVKLTNKTLAFTKIRKSWFLVWSHWLPLQLHTKIVITKKKPQAISIVRLSRFQQYYISVKYMTMHNDWIMPHISIIIHISINYTSVSNSTWVIQTQWSSNGTIFLWFCSHAQYRMTNFTVDCYNSWITYTAWVAHHSISQGSVLSPEQLMYTKDAAAIFRCFQTEHPKQLTCMESFLATD